MDLTGRFTHLFHVADGQVGLATILYICISEMSNVTRSESRF